MKRKDAQKMDINRREEENDKETFSMAYIFVQ
jgi:hypothetical protein